MVLRIELGGVDHRRAAYTRCRQADGYPREYYKCQSKRSPMHVVSLSQLADEVNQRCPCWAATRQLQAERRSWEATTGSRYPTTRPTKRAEFDWGRSVKQGRRRHRRATQQTHTSGLKARRRKRILAKKASEGHTSNGTAQLKGRADQPHPLHTLAQPAHPIRAIRCTTMRAAEDMPQTTKSAHTCGAGTHGLEPNCRLDWAWAFGAPGHSRHGTIIRKSGPGRAHAHRGAHTRGRTMREGRETSAAEC